MGSNSTRIALLFFILLLLAGNLANLSVAPKRLEITIQSEYGDLCQVFFDTGGGFSEQESLQAAYPGGRRFHKISFTLPEENLKFLRIDPGTEGVRHLIGSIRLLRWVPLYQFSLVEIARTAASNQIGDLRWKDGALHVESTGNDPAFSFPVDQGAILSKSRKIVKIWWNLLIIPAFFLYLARRRLRFTAKRCAAFVSSHWKRSPFHKKAAVVVFLLSPFFLGLPVHIPFNSLIMRVKGNGDSLFQVFYDRGEGFNQRDSSKFYVKMDESRYRTIRVRVPSRSERFRIDPGASSSALHIGSISLNYGLISAHRWNPEEITRDFRPTNDIGSFEVRDGAVLMVAAGSDPSFMTPVEISKLRDRTLNRYLFFFSILVGAVAFFLGGIRKAIHPLEKSFRFFLIFLALITTPLLLFISSSSSLYLGNQELLAHQVRVLAPFTAAFVAGLGVGVIAYGLYSLGKNRWSGMLLWLYFIAGPAFLFFQSFKTVCPFLDSAPGAFLILALFFAGGAFLFRSVEPRRAVPYFAFFAVLLALYEIFNFLKAFEPPMARTDGGPPVYHDALLVADGKSGLPNIYHIILDEYQTDMFEKTLTPEVEKGLTGFIYYPNNVTNYGGTTLSVPSVFTGSRYDLGDFLAYCRAAFQEGPSMLIPLKEAGYGLYGFIFEIREFYPVQPTLFDHVTNLMDESLLEKFGNADETFRMLWIYRNMPIFVSRRFISSDDLQSFRNQQGMPGHFELMSRYAFINFLEIERRLPHHNRYTFLHFLLPHTPYILSDDCSYSITKTGIRKTSSHDQARCTTKLIIDFIRTLKALNRFDEALILIHADHGRRENLENITSLDLARNASRALLLIKPPARVADTPFEVSTLETMLLDIPPTVLQSIGHEPLRSFEGLSLLNPRSFPESRPRPFVIYDESRYVLYNVENGNLIPEEIIPR